MRLEQFVANCLVQQQLDSRPLAHRRPQFFVEHLDLVFAVSLRPVHRTVGVMEHGLHGGAFAGDGDADARGDHDLFGTDADRPSQRVEHAVRDVRRVGLAGEIGTDHDELVAAESRHGVERPDGVQQPPCCVG